MSYQSLPFTIAAGATERVDVTGAYVVCTAANLISFKLAMDGGPRSEFRQGFSLRAADGFRYLEIVNPWTVPLVVRLAIGDGDFEDRRLLINGPQGITPITIQDLRDAAYAFQLSGAPAAGQYLHNQIWNPVGSGKLIALTQLYVGSDTAGQITLHEHDTALVFVNASFSKYLAGGVGGAAEARRTSSATQLAVYMPLGRLLLEAGVTMTLTFTQPIIIPAGKGLVVAHQATDATLFMTANLLEIDG